MNTTLQALQHLFPAQPIRLKPIQGGRNNRAYQVQLAEKKYFCKHYNQPTDKQRSRLSAEYEFLTYAAACQSPFTARPVCCDQVAAIGVYEYIEGNSFSNKMIGDHEINAALSFLESINYLRDHPLAKNLGVATESCFSISSHLYHVTSRVNRLFIGMEQTEEIDKAAYQFIKNRLLPTWRRIQARVQTKLLPNDTHLCYAKRMISPSDFGFHNALQLTDSRIKFVDFEYAGWDDPAKLIGDFFSQIEVPIPIKFLTKFISTLHTLVKDEWLTERILLLLPVYRIKWSCIVLNYFLPSLREKKMFAHPVTIEFKKSQLEKANKIVDSLPELEMIL